MKIRSIAAAVSCVLVPLSPWIASAQGTSFLSNLDQPSAGAYSVASNSWVAASFATGTDAAGYSLESVQLAMANATGSPDAFVVSLCANSNVNPANTGVPGPVLASLAGSSDPFAGGVYTYTASNTTLLPSTFYWVVVTAGTKAVTGAYGWSYSSLRPDVKIDGWGEVNAFLYSTDDGTMWIGKSPLYPQLAINAVVVPEPSATSLVLLSGGFLTLSFTRRRRG